MKVLAIAAVLAILGGAYPTHAQTSEQITRESHETNYKKTKKDREISQMIKRHEHRAHHHRRTHHHRMQH